MCGSIEVERPLYRFNRLVLRRPTPRNKSVLNESQPQSRPRTKLGGMTRVEQVRAEEPNDAGSFVAYPRCAEDDRAEPADEKPPTGHSRLRVGVHSVSDQVR